ncbi:MAG: glycogen synthase (ADP-glucose) [Firmicutes bacterium]|nr:glycogen synthase (ADP-glucose) [Bacillota bacterium]
MKVLFAASEVAPFIKTGGLGDVAFSLPKALVNAGVDCRVILPKYLDIPSYFKDHMNEIMTVNEFFSIEHLEYEGIQFYFVGNDEFFEREGIYGFEDDDSRFDLFCRSVLYFIDTADEFVPDIIHCNDWHTSLIPYIIKEKYQDSEKVKGIKTMLTIHNLKYQGVFDYGSVVANFLQIGIFYADRLTTVSRTYAEEIMTPEFGEGLEEVLLERRDFLTGITNGIDTDFYNPETDKDIFENFSSSNPAGKKKNKRELQRFLGLDKMEGVPLIAMVSRIDIDKGFDLVADIMKELMEMDVQFVLLGKGDRQYEDLFEEYSIMEPETVSSNIVFSTKLAKQIYAGADIFLMPSLYEACGISQLIALRYGTVPIVRDIGGLRDTVENYDAGTDSGTGFVFKEYNARELLDTIKKAVAVYRQKDSWERLVARAMGADNSWAVSSKMYMDIYRSMLK